MKSAFGGDFRLTWVCRYLVGMWAVLSSRSVTNRGKQGASDCRYAAQRLAAAAMLCVSSVAPERLSCVNVSIWVNIPGLGSTVTVGAEGAWGASSKTARHAQDSLRYNATPIQCAL